MKKVEINPGGHQYSSDFLPEMIQALYYAKVYTGTVLDSYLKEKAAGGVVNKDDYVPVIEWAWQIPADALNEDFGFTTFKTREWIMHIHCVAQWWDHDAGNIGGVVRLAMFEADHTGRIENISHRPFRDMADGEEYPGFVTDEYEAKCNKNAARVAMESTKYLPESSYDQNY